jgi:ABC-2 type transport system ATP-binding protein
MEEFEACYVEVTVHPQQVAAARALKPIHERQVLGRSILLFDLKPGSKPDLNSEVKSDRVDRQQVAALGDVRTPSIADLFVAMLGNTQGNKPVDNSGQAQGMPK